MLSTRGRTYAALDLAAGYRKERGHPFDKKIKPNGLVSLTNAENFLMQDKALTFVKEKGIKSLDVCSLTYHDGPFGSRRLKQAMANFLNMQIRPESQVTTNCISFVAGVTAINSIVSCCLTEEGEGILLGMPIYGSFAPDLQTTSNCKLVYTPFKGVDQFSVAAVDCYERALQEAEQNGTKVRAMFITNPHNPLGRCYPRETLEAIVHFCIKHQIHLISDEIYAFSVYRADEVQPGFTSVLSIGYSDINNQGLVHVLYGLSKDFAVAGLRLGCLVSKNTELNKAVESLARFHGASPVTDAIATAILEDESFYTQFLKESSQALGEHQAIATKALDDAGIQYSQHANAGFFLWLDLSACLSSPSWEAEDDLKQKIYDYGVEMSSGHAYHDEVPGRFRFIFSVNRDTLIEGLRRVVSFYKENKRDQSTQ